MFWKLVKKYAVFNKQKNAEKEERQEAMGKTNLWKQKQLTGKKISGAQHIQEETDKPNWKKQNGKNLYVDWGLIASICHISVKLNMMQCNWEAANIDLKWKRENKGKLVNWGLWSESVPCRVLEEMLKGSIIKDLGNRIECNMDVMLNTLHIFLWHTLRAILFLGLVFFFFRKNYILDLIYFDLAKLWIIINDKENKNKHRSCKTKGKTVIEKKTLLSYSSTLQGY